MKKNIEQHQSVLSLTQEGKTSKEIGHILGISRARVSQIRAYNGATVAGRKNAKTEIFKALSPEGKIIHKRLKAVWAGMKNRCTNANCPQYGDYGGRGITVCEEWSNSFAAFKQWALNNGYKQGLAIDREDNDKGYVPENCRWITQKLNCRNTRKNLLLTAFGETKCLSEWIEDPRCSVSKQCLSIRLKRGWGVEAAITKPNEY